MTNVGPTSAAPVLVLGTANRKKGGELAELLVPLGFDCRTLADFPAAIDVEEVGDSFAENARLKATHQAARLGHWVLGDDSGLVVDSLQGAPGVFSARYACAGATDALNRQKLLKELAGVALQRRTAHFVCHLALADPAGNVRAEAVGRCQGRIRATEAGGLGFGYDPLFEVVEYHRTFGELSAAVKGVLSHRARAIGAIAPALARAGRRGGVAHRG